MAKLYWLKLYYEILDDYKMVRLPDSTWRKVIELFLVAGIKNEKGLLPPIEEMAWMLRTDVDTIQKHIDLLMSDEVSIVVEVDGQLKIKNFEKRQAAMKKAEYVRRKREGDADYRLGWKATDKTSDDDEDDTEENHVRDYIVRMLDQTDPQQFKKTKAKLDNCEIVEDALGKILIIPNDPNDGSWLIERFMPYKKLIINGSKQYSDIEIVS